jgi:hypothetical protein
VRLVEDVVRFLVEAVCHVELQAKVFRVLDHPFYKDFFALCKIFFMVPSFGQVHSYLFIIWLFFETGLVQIDCNVEVIFIHEQVSMVKHCMLSCEGFGL